MAKKLYLILAITILASLVIVGCSTETTTAPTTTSAAQTTSTVPTTTAAAGPEKPQYGGTITLITMGNPSTFDEGAGMMHAGATTLKQTNEELVTGDWARGLAGTGEFEWTRATIGKWDSKAGALAESWDIPDPGHIVFHIRKGVQYALTNSEASRLVNGRELTADDVVQTLTRYQSSPKCAVFYGDFKRSTMTMPDKWTVDIKIAPELFEEISVTTDFASIIPPEVVKRYGDMQDWRNSVGTGPFILKDYTESSSINFEKNPNYWGTDPVGPGKGNQLPYVDKVKMLIITDSSTSEAALRTAKADVKLNTQWEDAASLKAGTPTLMSKDFYSDISMAVSMRTDKETLPYHDVQVRRALMMATDFENIKNTYYDGTAQINTWPLLYTKEYANCYLPLEEAPESVQELYKYNPDKAKTLLADAGYPNGFKSTIICTSGHVDYLSIIKQMWAKVNVDLTFSLREGAVFGSIAAPRAYEDMIIMGPGPESNVYISFAFAGNMAMGNMSYVSDPKVEEARVLLRTYSVPDPPKADRIFKELMPYVLDQAWAIPAPTPPQYHLWYPWVKNYHGESSIGRDNVFNWTRYIWIDQDMKAVMTGR